ncbi:hypothetical protein JOQ06_028772, partial [Pogonophryne albipinna]
MRSTVRHELSEAVTASEDRPREQWLFDYPAQAVLHRPSYTGRPTQAVLHGPLHRLSYTGRPPSYTGPYTGCPTQAVLRPTQAVLHRPLHRLSYTGRPPSYTGRPPSYRPSYTGRPTQAALHRPPYTGRPTVTQYHIVIFVFRTHPASLTVQAESVTAGRSQIFFYPYSVSMAVSEVDHYDIMKQGNSAITAHKST